MNQGLSEMLKYNAWANRELFKACRSLTEDHLDARVPGSSRSVRELLMHIAGGEQTFVLRTKGRQHEGGQDHSTGLPGVDRLIEIVASTSDELISIAEQLQDNEEVELPYQDKTYRYPKRFFLVHAMEHSAEHRTEVKVALAQVGVQTPDLDGWYYAAAAGYGQEVVNPT